MEVGRERERKKRERSQKNLDTGESAVCWTGEPGQADRSLASTVGALRLGPVLQLRCRSPAIMESDRM